MPSYVVEVRGTFYREFLVYAGYQEDAEERVLDYARDLYDPDSYSIDLSCSRKAKEEDLYGVESLDDEDVIVAGIEEAEDAEVQGRAPV